MKKYFFAATAALAVAIFMPVTASAATCLHTKALFSSTGSIYDYVLYIPDEEEYEEDYEEEYEEEGPLLFRTTANLNLRRGPSTDAARITTISRGTIVTVTDLRDSEWVAVEVHGQTGYMYKYFLTQVTQAEAEAAGELTITEINGNVERLHWSEARNVLTRGQAFTVVDVRTGITWQMASFSHGNHADVEPVTADDTAAMRQAFGGRWDWTPRPIHIHVNGRILAASINGMPHAGSTNHNNNMNGHVCIHFYGSRTHNGSRGHERDHQNAVNEAFRAGGN